MDLRDLRRSYFEGGLSDEEAGSDPLALFKAWLQQAIDRGLTEPHGMVLATVSADGTPSTRTVLLRAVDERGLVFFTNYESRKGRELSRNPNASLLFWWAELERQVRIDGRVERVADDESDRYFAVRPRGHQLAAWASAQSAVVPSREALEQRMSEMEARFADQPVPRPKHWGGFRVQPREFEFWCGRPNRLHDRLRFSLQDGNWVRERLAP